MAKKMKGDYTQEEFNAILDVLVKMVKMYASETYHFSIETGYLCSLLIAIHHWRDDKNVDMIMVGIPPWKKEENEILLNYIGKCLADHTDSDEFYKGLKHIVKS